MPPQDDVRIITSSSDGFGAYFLKIWKYRSLVWVFAKRDLKVKYAQTIIGLGWTLMQPLITLAIFTFFFGFLLNWETEGIVYPVYILSGLLGWNFFSYTVSAGVAGLQESSHLIKKIYFPKSIIPLSKMVLGLMELGVGLALLVVLLIYFGQPLSLNVIFVPIVLFYNIICALCIVFWFSAFASKKRDILHLIPFFLTFGIWFSPVFFGSDILPAQYAFILDINPMANVVQAWRWSLFGFGEIKWVWGINFAIVWGLLLVGMYVYNRQESNISDYV